MIRIDEIRQIIFNAYFLQVGKPFEACGRVFQLKFVIKIADNKRCIGKKPVIEEMVPPEGARSVSPGKSELIRKLKYIPAGVESHKKPVLIVGLPVNFCIDVIKMY